MADVVQGGTGTAPRRSANQGAGIGVYQNPFRGIASLVNERIDMGVDVAGTGPVYALGPGVITAAGDAWAGAVGAPYPGTWITERLTSGPAAGQTVYVAEDIYDVRVRQGQQVDSSTQLGTLRGGLETGWAAPGPSGQSGETLAASLGQSASGGDPGAWSSAAGASYGELLSSVGGPGGVLGAGGVHGQLPSSVWPQLGTLAGSRSQAGGASGPGGPSSGGLGDILSGTGSLFHGMATALDWLFGFWYPGQGWRIVFGAAAIGSGWGAIGAWRSAQQSGGSALPLAVGLSGAAALAAFMALRPWPMVGTQPVKPGAYLVETLEGQPPVAGQPRPKDVTGIEIGLGVLAGAWLASKLASAGSSILSFLAGLGLAGARGGAAEVPPPDIPLPDVVP